MYKSVIFLGKAGKKPGVLLMHSPRRKLRTNYVTEIYTPVQLQRKTYNKHFIRLLKAFKEYHPCSSTTLWDS